MATFNVLPGDNVLYVTLSTSKDITFGNEFVDSSARTMVIEVAQKAQTMTLKSSGVNTETVDIPDLFAELVDTEWLWIDFDVIFGKIRVGKSLTMEEDLVELE